MNPPTNISDKETCLQDFVVILKRSLQNYYKILKTSVLDISWTITRSLTIVLPVTEGNNL